MFSRNEMDSTNADAISQASLAQQPTTHLPPVEETQVAGNITLPAQHLPPVQMVFAQSTVSPTIPVGTHTPEAPAYLANYAQPGLPQNTYTQQEKAFPRQPGHSGASLLRKRHFRLWPLLLAIVIFVLGSGTALAVVVSQQPGNTPTEALQAYCDGYKTSNAQEVYDSLSAASQKETSLRKIQQGFDVLKLFGNTAHISDCSISNVQQQDATAIGDIKMTVDVSGGNFSFSTSVHLPMELVLENNIWKVDTPQTRFAAPTPELTPGLLSTPTVTNQ